MDLREIRSGMVDVVPERLVDELLEGYGEAKRNFFLGGLRLSAVEGGRFCEAAYRILEQVTIGSHTPLGVPLDADALARRLASFPASAHSPSLRLHIPRALRVVYDVRNNRDAAHLGDGIDPNLQDATLVTSILDWVLAEFVRLFHGISPGEAQAVVEDIVTRRSPAIQEFDGFLKVLRPGLRAGDHTLLLLYERGKLGAAYEDLMTWSPPRMRGHLRRTLGRLVEAGLVHRAGDRYAITIAGQREAEERGIALPA